MLEICYAILEAPSRPDALLRGGLIGILGLAGLFNLILLFANPRNISHLIFSGIGLLATVAVALPYFSQDQERLFLEFQIFHVLLPILLFWFVYVLFPALRRSHGRESLEASLNIAAGSGTPGEFIEFPGALYSPAVAGGIFLATPAAIGLGFAALFAPAPAAGLSDGDMFFGQALWLARFGAGYLVFTIACTAGILIAATAQRQQGAIVASLGFFIFAAGACWNAFGQPDYFTASESVVQPRIVGVLGFVLSMVVLMGPNRYQMHRQLRRSRNVLREANRKLRHLDTVKNRYITGSAREMQAPLQGMLEQCLRLIEDPSYRLGRSQLAALSDVMDMARRMIQRNERAAVLFEETEIRAREFDALNFFEMLVVVLEEQLEPLRINFVNAIPNAQQVPLFADPTLIEAAFIELAENARAHGTAERVEIRIGPGRRDPRRVRLSFYEAPLEHSPERLQELSEEFQRGAPAGPDSGIGLGLSLVRRIAESHGSALTIHRASRRSQATADAEHGYEAKSDRDSRTETNGVEFSFSVPRAGATAMRPPEVEWGLKHLRFLLRHALRDQAVDEARQLARRFPEFRSEAFQLLADSEAEAFDR